MVIQVGSVSKNMEKGHRSPGVGRGYLHGPIGTQACWEGCGWTCSPWLGSSAETKWSVKEYIRGLSVPFFLSFAPKVSPYWWHMEASALPSWSRGPWDTRRVVELPLCRKPPQHQQLAPNLLMPLGQKSRKGFAGRFCHRASLRLVGG